MTDTPANHEPLEPLLDALPPGPEREEAIARLRRAGRGAEVDTDLRIDDSLRRLFAPAAAPEEQVQAVAGMTAAPRPARFRRGALWGAAFGAAAAVLAIAVLAPSRSPSVAPHFEPRPLAALYHEAVENGFEPYYECEDDARFAAVFAKRQGVALALRPMPSGSRMLGLSYPGGMTRQTTAMLCEVDGAPVMVFVDRDDADNAALARAGREPELRVFRSELPGLVIYEVTPLDEQRAAQYLTLASPR